MKPVRDPVAGFSLVEVLVAMAVAGMVVIGTSGLTSLTWRAEEKFDRESAARDQIVAADKILRELVTTSVPQVGGHDAGASPASADRFTLLTMGSAIMVFDRPSPVTLAVRDRADGAKALVVVWRDPHSNAEREEVAIDGARSISLSYFGADPGKPAVWRGDWPYVRRLPQAVSMRVDYPVLGPPIDLIARTFTRFPQVCAALPHEFACNRGLGQAGGASQ